MPAKDIFHNTVKTALEKNGWIITDEHLFIKIDSIDFYVDLAALENISCRESWSKDSCRDKIFLRIICSD